MLFCSHQPEFETKRIAFYMCFETKYAKSETHSTLASSTSFKYVTVHNYHTSEVKKKKNEMRNAKMSDCALAHKTVRFNAAHSEIQ